MPANGARSTAGAYADQRYKRGLRNYHVKTRWLLACVFSPVIIAGTAFLILQGHPYTWVAGLATGAFGAAWFILRDEPPAYVQNWREGAEGERKTAKSLKPLQRSGLRVLHDVERRYGNYDHIAVGRVGVFLLETKNLKGIVEIRDGVPHLRRRLDPDVDVRLDRIRPRALSAAAGLKSDIERRTGHRTWVQAVVVLWSDFPQGYVEHDRCIFIHGPRLRAWMTDRADELNQVQAAKLIEAVEQIASQPPRQSRGHSHAGSSHADRP
jgi:hypothetical protein